MPVPRARRSNTLSRMILAHVAQSPRRRSRHASTTGYPGGPTCERAIISPNILSIKYNARSSLAEIIIRLRLLCFCRVPWEPGWPRSGSPLPSGGALRCFLQDFNRADAPWLAGQDANLALVSCACSSRFTEHTPAPPQSHYILAAEPDPPLTTLHIATVGRYCPTVAYLWGEAWTDPGLWWWTGQAMPHHDLCRHFTNRRRLLLYP